MSQHDTLTQALQQIADWNSHTTEYAVDYGSNGVRDFYRNIARAALSATQPAQAEQGEPTEGLREQHDRDSKELRSICQARDDARRERDIFRVEIAGLNSSVGHLSALVDHQSYLLSQAMQVMKMLQESAAPDDGPDMDAIIPAAAFSKFVDDNARLMYLVARSPAAVAQGAGEVVAWCTPDGERCVTARTYEGARKDGGAMWSSMAPFTVPAFTQPAAGADVPPAQPAPVVPEGWEIREEATWVYFKRPDGFYQAVTPNDSHQSHAQTLHMLMRAMLAATPTPPAQAAADARDAELPPDGADRGAEAERAAMYGTFGG